MRAVIEAKSDEITSFNPATGAEVGRVPVTSPDEVKEAVNRARDAFQNGRKTSFNQRATYIMKAREVVLSEMDEIAHLISAESGKPFGEAISMEIAPVLDLMQYFARKAEKMLRPKSI